MFIALLLATAQAKAHFSILFLGNSHTANNDVPGMVKALMESDGSKRTVTVRSVLGPHLEDIARDQSPFTGTPPTFVVMQGAMVSSSHRYTYSQAGAIKLAQTAKKIGATTFLYSEWARRDWDETEYTLDVYRGIAKATGAHVVPVGYAWDALHKAEPSLDLWQADGNHATQNGSYLAACCLYFSLSGTRSTPTWRPREMPANVQRVALKFARGATPE